MKKFKNPSCLSFKGDKKLLSRLGINDVFFFAINFSFNKLKVTKKLERLIKIRPSIEECYVLCDRDTQSFSDTQIEANFKKIKSIIIANQKLNISSVRYLEYKKPGQNFESFLKAHSVKKALPSGYSKTDKNLYKKTMGINGASYEVLIKNLSYFDGKGAFSVLFSKRTPKLFQ